MTAPRTIETDVLVVGAGVAGVGAAVGAAREGARTLLLGEEDVPGGVVVAGLHRSMCGLFGSGPTGPDQTLNDGVTRDLVRLLRGKDERARPEKMGRVYVLPLQTDLLVEALEEILAATPSLQVRFGTRVTEANRDGARLIGVDAQDSTGAPLQVAFSSLVDCTGHAAVIRLADTPTQETAPSELQLAGQSILLGGVRDPEDLLPIRVPYELAQASRGGEIPRHLRFTQFVPGAQPRTGIVKLSVPPVGDGREVRAREEAEQVLDLLRDRLEELREARVLRRSPRVVDREGDRIRGAYTLTDDDVLSARKFQDGVVKNAWPIELWDGARGPRYEYLPDGEHYEIPLRCLKVAALENAWAAGRCISATHRAHASTRASGTCLALGEKAGQHAARER